MIKRPRNFLAACLLCLAGCAVGPDYRTPDIQMPDKFVAADFAAPQKAAKDKRPVIDAALWWRGLKDPELDALIERAVRDNPDIAQAVDRMQESRAQEEVVLGHALPDVSGSVGAGAGTGSDLARGRAAQSLVSGEDTGGLQQVTHVEGFDAAWQLDLFGQYRREMEQASADTQAAIAVRNGVLISVIADVARAYIDMRAAQMQSGVLQKNIDIAQDYVKLTKERFARGITNGYDVALAQRQLDALHAQIMPLAAKIHAAQYVIATLLGQFPETMSHELDKPALIPAVPAAIDGGVPIDLLRRRPDIVEADREAAAASAGIGVAEADLFPHVSLTGAAGYQGGVGLRSATPGFIWSVGPSVDWALLDFGALDAKVDIADFQAKASLINYKKTVLNAVREVDTAMDAYKARQDQLTDLGDALAASQRAVDLATQRYARGLTDSLNVIDAERQDYEIESEYVAARRQAAEQFVVLYKALGGGWEKNQSFPALPRPQPAVVAALSRLF